MSTNKLIIKLAAKKAEIHKNIKQMTFTYNRNYGTNQRKRVDNKIPFTKIIRNFTDAIGGDVSEFMDLLYAKFIVEDFLYSDDLNYHKVKSYFETVVVPHKIAVYQSGLELTRQDWFKDLCICKETFLYNLWIHDMSKFSANEAFGYAFYNRKNESGRELFNESWHHHKANNPHHPEHWADVHKSGDLVMRDMPIIYILEMIADWTGAGLVYGNEIANWLPDNLHRFRFSEKTTMILQFILSKMGFDTIYHLTYLQLED